METAIIAAFSYVLAFAVGMWLRQHLALACLAGMALVPAAWLAVKVGDLAAPVVLVTAGALCGAFRYELAPFWAKCRGSIRAAATGRRTEDSKVEEDRKEEEPPRAYGFGPGGTSSFGRGPSPEERKRREQASQHMRGGRSGPDGCQPDQDRERRESEAKAKRERAEEEAKAKAKERERADAAARDRARQEERQRKDWAEARARREKEEADRARRDRARAGSDAGEEARRVPNAHMSVEDALAALGLARGAGPRSIKQAHRKLAARWHPDKNPGNEAAVKQFLRAQAAYESLKAAGMTK